MNACRVDIYHYVQECGEQPEKKHRESDPVRYCGASHFYLECVHDKYRGCENKEKYEMVVESMLKDFPKRVDDLIAFCSDKIENYKINIVCESSKQAETADSIRNGSSHSPSGSLKYGTLSSSSAQSLVTNDLCQVKTIRNLCGLSMMNDKLNLSWNKAGKHDSCQQAMTYVRCLTLRENKCPQQNIQNEFIQLILNIERYIIINCPISSGCPPIHQDIDSFATMGLTSGFILKVWMWLWVWMR
ncbi:unnamed protein product [Adineta steineri]|uniref:Uncharacterized protein n=1 Tax=Adineta steineri TaxID=433720 RepID=A0A819GLK3_9BILA|nr:unnamed protein product [Adineta steineri]CAF1242391.1 unnamed protein product [Adineta steineri]CAF3562132.1 unnamed protein product [Adineta steineri]CAF3883737.1 unnamed protein product [Adineta steineri]